MYFHWSEGGNSGGEERKLPPHCTVKRASEEKKDMREREETMEEKASSYDTDRESGLCGMCDVIPKCEGPASQFI